VKNKYKGKNTAAFDYIFVGCNAIFIVSGCFYIYIYIYMNFVSEISAIVKYWISVFVIL